jgi:hypothetical protein
LEKNKQQEKPDKAVPEKSTNNEKWRPTKTRTSTQQIEPDRACWLYVHNNNTRDMHNRRYTGDREQWKEALSTHLG